MSQKKVQDQQLLLNYILGNRVTDVFRVAGRGAADVTWDNSEALVIAATLGYSKMFKLLETLGCDFKARARECLKVARQNGHVRMADVLQKRIWELESQGLL